MGEKKRTKNPTDKQDYSFQLCAYLGVWSAVGSLQAEPGPAGLITGFSTAMIQLWKLGAPIIPSRHPSLSVCRGSTPEWGSPSTHMGNLHRDNEELTVPKTYYILLTSYTSAGLLTNKTIPTKFNWLQMRFHEGTELMQWLTSVRQGCSLLLLSWSSCLFPTWGPGGLLYSLN